MKIIIPMAGRGSRFKNNGYLFNINTKLSTKYNDINEKYLIKLGSYGLFNRINKLKNIDKDID